MSEFTLEQWDLMRKKSWKAVYEDDEFFLTTDITEEEFHQVKLSFPPNAYCIDSAIHVYIRGEMSDVLQNIKDENLSVSGIQDAYSGLLERCNLLNSQCAVLSDFISGKDKHA